MISVAHQGQHPRAHLTRNPTYYTMQLGNTIAKACSTFALTNIDDLFVLVTFFALAAAGKTTPLNITIGQYLGFTVIIAVSMIGFAVAIALPPEPIGFLGWVPMMLGVWGVLGLFFAKMQGEDETEETEDDEDDEDGGKGRVFKQIGSVALVTLTNGGDNISTYTPLFAQAKGAEVAVYIVTYYILLGTWCLIGFLTMKQKHVLTLAERYARWVIPWLYVGLGVYIVVSSECYPWSVGKVDDDVTSHPGSVIMGVVTAVVIGGVVGAMVWVRLRRRAARARDGGGSEVTAGEAGSWLGNSASGGTQDGIGGREFKAADLVHGPDKGNDDKDDIVFSRRDIDGKPPIL